jgi:hypothetical protein
LLLVCDRFQRLVIHLVSPIEFLHRHVSDGLKMATTEE